MEYHASLDYGQGGDTTIEADSIEEAMDGAMEWAAGGDWSVARESMDLGLSEASLDVRVRVWREDPDGEIREEAVETYVIPYVSESE